MPSMRSSRRAQGLKDSDFDHEIDLVDHDASISTHRALSPETTELGRTSTSSRLLREEAQEASTSAHLGDQEPGDVSRTDEGQDDSRLDIQETRTTGPSIEVEQPTPFGDAHTRNGNGNGHGGRSSRPKTAERESAIDILWENERGGFLCGIALFSGKALGNLDPAPWTNEHHKASPTTTKTAQVPDPAWEWAWPEWRVNREDGVAMDEFGWEYSFMFAKKFSWHGPKWWNSFVRRRAWIRKRIKRRAEDISADPHMLNPNYFNVQPAPQSRSQSRSGSHRSKASVSQISYNDTDAEVEKFDIEDIETLLGVLRTSRIDREKLEAVENYLEHARDDLVHLQDEMHDIMSLFVFQASRRVLISRLTHVYDEMDGLEGKVDPDKLKLRKGHLAAAIKHADEEVKRLSYWSDMKEMAEKGQSKALEENEGWGEEWQGLDQSGPAHATSAKLP